MPIEDEIKREVESEGDGINKTSEDLEAWLEGLEYDDEPLPEEGEVWLIRPGEQGEIPSGEAAKRNQEEVEQETGSKKQCRELGEN
jgi:hypothetical protein